MIYAVERNQHPELSHITREHTQKWSREDCEHGATSEATKAMCLLEALYEAERTIQWMLDNMSVDNRQLQSDAFNIPMNTLDLIEQTINNYLNK